MPWRPLEIPEPPETAQPLNKKSRFFVDESLGEEAANWLRERGYSATYAGDVGLLGHSDDDIFSYAWRERRMLLTHDRDFLDDKRFPEHRNPGLVVLPGGDGNQEAMGVGMGMALSVFGSSPESWEKSKSVISPTGQMTIRHRHWDRKGRLHALSVKQGTGRNLGRLSRSASPRYRPRKGLLARCERHGAPLPHQKRTRTFGRLRAHVAKR
jgi:predicted nuclease of predicted toxin-antitoxin system